MNALTAKTTKVQIAVIGDQPEDIGLILGKGNRGKEKNRQEHDYAFHGYGDCDLANKKGQATLPFYPVSPESSTELHKRWSKLRLVPSNDCWPFCRVTNRIS